MKKIIVAIAFATTAILSQAQTQKWGYDASHAKVGFSISHFGISETEGKFTKFDGTVLSAQIATQCCIEKKMEFPLNI